MTTLCLSRGGYRGNPGGWLAGWHARLRAGFASSCALPVSRAQLLDIVGDTPIARQLGAEHGRAIDDLVRRIRFLP